MEKLDIKELAVVYSSENQSKLILARTKTLILRVNQSSKNKLRFYGTETELQSVGR